MDVTLLGMVTEVRKLQPEKAELPMDVTLKDTPLYTTDSGMFTTPLYPLSDEDL
jgi:hypothetical protein